MLYVKSLNFNYFLKLR